MLSRVQEITSLPSSLQVGTSFLLRLSSSSYPASDWDSKLVLTGPSKVELARTADGDDHLFRLTPAASAGLTNGLYQWSWRATRGTGDDAESKLIAHGQLVLTPDLHAAATGTQQSFAEKQLAMIDAVIAARLACAMTAELTEWAIANLRSGRRADLSELYTLRRQCARQVARERNLSGKGRLVPMRFSNAEAS